MVMEALRLRLPPVGSNILDVGAATGVNAIALADVGYNVVAVEIESHLVERASHARHYHPVSYCQADARVLPFRPDVFDAAIVIEVLEHIQQPELVIKELHRVLKPSCLLCIAVPTDYTERMYRRLHPRYALNAGHVNTFSKHAICELLYKNSFEVEDIEIHNLVPALAWLAHSLLRSDSDQTGVVLEHTWIDLIAAGVVRMGRHVPLLGWAIDRFAARFGKSIYIYCRAATLEQA